MKYIIKRRWYSSLEPITVEIGAEFEASSESVKLGAAIKVAVRAGADLAGAYLAGADLARADLAGAKIPDDQLAAALKVDMADVPIVEKIDAAILAAIEQGGSLDMSSWHGTEDNVCGTTHCRAGWAVHLAGKAGKELQDRFGPQIAGTLIYHKSRPGQPSPWFFDSDENAMADIRKCAAEQNAA